LGFGATFVGRFGKEFWQGILEGSLGFGATFCKRYFCKTFWQGVLEGSLGFRALFVKDTFVGRFSKVAYIKLYFYNIKTIF